MSQTQIVILKNPPKINKRCARCDILLIHSKYNDKFLVFQVGRKSNPICVSCALHTKRITENDLPKPKKPKLESLIYSNGVN